MKLNLDFKDIIKEYIIKNNLFIKTIKSKYTLDDILKVLVYILSNGASWRSLDLEIFENKYKWQSIYYHFNKWNKLNIFEKIYKQLLTKYFKKNLSGKLKFLSVDSSFIKNECASKKLVALNGHYKKKRLCKLSLIVDSNGIPISAILAAGNAADNKLLLQNFNNMYIDVTYSKKNNKHKRYMLADAGYDTQEVKNKIKDFNIIPIIDYNKRNTKDKKIINNKILTERECDIYCKRIKIENSFSWLYKNRRLSKMYDKHYITYFSFFFISLIKIIIKRI
jgi:transposase